MSHPGYQVTNLPEGATSEALEEVLLSVGCTPMRVDVEASDKGPAVAYVRLPPMPAPWSGEVHTYKAHLQQEQEAAAAAGGQAADGGAAGQDQAAAEGQEGAAAEGQEGAEYGAAAGQLTASPSKGPASEPDEDDGHAEGDSARFAKHVARVLKGKGLEMGGNQLEFSGGGNLQVMGQSSTPLHHHQQQQPTTSAWRAPSLLACTTEAAPQQTGDLLHIPVLLPGPLQHPALQAPGGGHSVCPIHCRSAMVDTSTNLCITRPHPMPPFTPSHPPTHPPGDAVHRQPAQG
jgi:hypothetical protein